MLLDRFGREVTYMRISVTDHCNLVCSYCRPKGKSPPPVSYLEHLRWEDLLRIARVAVSLGIRRLRVTGGEPLVRSGIVSFVSSLTRLPGVEHVALTTNGTFLARYAQALKQAGVGGINVSLDTLNPQKFSLLTGQDRYHQVWEGIQEALRVGFSPIKINVVAMKGINDDEVEDFLALTRDGRFIVRFIELMPLGLSQEWTREHYLSGQSLKDLLEKKYTLLPAQETLGNGPARYFVMENGGVVGFITLFGECFCATCNRIRLTSDGWLKPCLWSPGVVNLKPLLAGEDWEAAVGKAIQDALLVKEERYDLAHAEGLRMSEIGG